MLLQPLYLGHCHTKVWVIPVATGITYGARAPLQTMKMRGYFQSNNRRDFRSPNVIMR